MGEKKKVAYEQAAKEPASKSETWHNDKWKEVKPLNAITILGSVLDRCLMYCISLWQRPEGSEVFFLLLLLFNIFTKLA